MFTVFIPGMILKWGKYGLCPGILRKIREKREGMKMEGGSRQNHKKRDKSTK